MHYRFMIFTVNASISLEYMYHSYSIAGFHSWDSNGTGCDIAAELSAVANEAPTGVAGANGMGLYEFVYLLAGDE